MSRQGQARLTVSQGRQRESQGSESNCRVARALTQLLVLDDDDGFLLAGISPRRDNEH